MKRRRIVSRKSPDGLQAVRSQAPGPRRLSWQPAPSRAALAAAVLLLAAGLTVNWDPERARSASQPTAQTSHRAHSAAQPAVLSSSPGDIRVPLPGPVYDLAYDKARNSLWFAFMASGEADALYPSLAFPCRTGSAALAI